MLERVDSLLICLPSGFYHTLSVRLYRNIQKSWIGNDIPLRANEFVNLEEAKQRFNTADPQQTNQAALA